jgi:hypothetical protein
MTRKVLWVVDGDMAGLLERAHYVRAQAVCIRTTNGWLKGAIPTIKGQGFDVYAWRWPAVRPTNPPPAHYYADDEAQYVLGLIAGGLDGYIADPESDGDQGVNDWNDSQLANLANQFCDTIKIAGRQKNPQFLFGITSGCNYPTLMKNIPWSVFVAHCDAVYPQMYWAPNIRNRHTPEDAYNVGMTSWRTVVPGSMKVYPIVGEIETVKADEIARFGTIMTNNSISEVHFYTYTSQIPPQNWDALRNLGQAALVA